MLTGLQRALDEFERRCIVYALQRHGGNITHSAIALGLTRVSLQRKIRRLGIKDRGVRHPRTR